MQVSSGQTVTKPPLGLIVSPTKKLASSEQRKAIAAAISSGRPRRPWGVPIRTAPISGSVSEPETSWVSTKPGAIALTRTPCWISSLATVRVKARMPPFAAE